MSKHIEQIGKFLKSLNRRQQVLLGTSAAAVAVTLFIFVKLFSAPAMAPLYAGLSTSDSQAMVQRLTSRGITYQLAENGGTILVPADQLNQLRMQMATAGPPATGRMGWKLFDQPNWSGSDFSEKVNYQRALEGELERTIDTIADVAESRVHLVLPHESLYTEEQRPGKAAVVLKLRGTLSKEAVQGIGRLVSGAVDNLPVKNVTIIDADTGAPLIAREADGEGVDSPQLEAKLAKKIVNTLAPIFGSDHVRASVTVERDPSTADSTRETYDPDSSVVLTSQVSQETGAASSPQGVPGTASNVPKAGSKPPAADQTSAPTLPRGLASESKTFAVSKTVSHTNEPAGRIERIDAAVIVDDATVAKVVDGKTEQVRQKRTPEEMKQIEELTRAAIGFDAKRGDQVVVQNLSFQVLPAPKLEPVPLPERVLRLTDKWMGVLRLAGLFALFALVYWVLLRPLKNQVITSLRQMPKLAAEPVAAIGAVGAKMGEALGTPAELQEFESELQVTNSEVKRVVMLKRNLVDKVKSEPEAAGRLVENWIRQGKGAS
jgi:flagellar M-ring protein FliF